MDPLVILWIFLIGAIAGLLLGLTLVYRTAVYPLHRKIKKLSTGLLPKEYMSKYPYDIDNFRYIGDPVDGIQFEEDRVIFIKIINTQPKPSEVPDKIKSLVKKHKVEWFEFKAG